MLCKSIALPESLSVSIPDKVLGFLCLNASDIQEFLSAISVSIPDRVLSFLCRKLQLLVLAKFKSFNP